MKGRRMSSALLRFNKGDGVEVSSDEEGFRGAWFPATIVKKVGVGKGYLIEYRDLTTEDRKSKLRETVKAPYIRPQPPTLNRQCFCLNEVVDAYDRDGWWRGVVKAILRRNNKYVVCFQETKEQREYNLKQIRVHQDWKNDKWVNASEVENMGLNEVNPNSPPLSTNASIKRSEAKVSESVRRSTNASIKRSEAKVSESVTRSANTSIKRSEAKVSQLSGEYKADGQCDNLQAGGSQLTIKSSKRKRGTKDQFNSNSARKNKFQKDVESTETQDEENLPESDVVGLKIDLHKDVGSQAKDEMITISIPYMEYVDQNRCSPCDTPGIRGKATLKQIQLLAYHSVLEALYLQKNLDWKQEILLTDLRDVLHVSNEEHAKELRCITSIKYN